MAKEHKAGASSSDALGQYLASNCATLTYFTMWLIQKDLTSNGSIAFINKQGLFFTIECELNLLN